jgi:hypothetical protein
MIEKATKHIIENYGENWLKNQWETDDVIDTMAEFTEQNVQEHKEVIKQLLETYVINLDDNGSPKASINDILQLIDKAKKLIK